MSGSASGNRVGIVGCSHCHGSREVLEPAKDFTFMGRLFTSGVKQVACPQCSVVQAVGIKTHHTTGMKSIAPLVFECRFQGPGIVIVIKDGGVTGHESVYFDDHFLDTARVSGWNACAGTPGRYSRLFVPAKEIREVLEKLGLT